MVPENSSEAADSLSCSGVKKESILCVVYKLDGFCGRANTLPAYADANRQILKGVCAGFAPARKIHSDAQLDPKAQVCKLSPRLSLLPVSPFLFLLASISPP